MDKPTWKWNVISISTDQGTRDREGLVFDCWAIHPSVGSVDRTTITHIPTGYGAGVASSIEDAMKVVEAYYESGDYHDLTLDDIRNKTFVAQRLGYIARSLLAQGVIDKRVSA